MESESNRMLRMALTGAERALVLDSLIVMLGIALSRSSALRQVAPEQGRYFADQCAELKRLIDRLQGAEIPHAK